MSDIILPGNVEKQLERERESGMPEPANDPAATDAEWEAMHGGAPDAGPMPELLVPSGEVLARRKVKLNALEAMAILTAIRQNAEARGWVDEFEVSATEQIADVFRRATRRMDVPKKRPKRRSRNSR